LSIKCNQGIFFRMKKVHKKIANKTGEKFIILKNTNF